MRGDADPALRWRQAEIAPHRPRQPGIACRIARPGAFVESTEDDQIGLLQSCLDQPPDRKPRVSAIVRAQHRSREQRFEQGGIVGTAQRWKIVNRFDELANEARDGLAGVLTPQASSAAIDVFGGERLGGGDMHRYQRGDRDLLLGKRREQGRQRDFEAAAEIMQIDGPRIDGRGEALKTGCRSRPAQRPRLELAHGRAQ